MEEILVAAGKIAGIGGLALGVFLLLFRRIELPRATRNHLTLFMWLVWSMCALGIVAYVVGTKLAETSGKKSSAVQYSGGISITYPDNEKFVSFLEQNLERTAFFATHIDMSLSSEESQRIEGLFGIDNFEEDPSKVLPLEGTDTGNMLQLHLLDRRKLLISHGGTGVVQFKLTGYFRITRTFHSGPSVVYHLTEIPVVMTESGR